MKNITVCLIALVIVLNFAINSFGQRPGGNRGNRDGRMPGKGIAGIVIDEKTGAPMELATIIVFNKSDSSKVNGTSSNERGRFFIKEIEDGEYYITVSFIGYETKRIDNIVINPSNKLARLKQIKLTPTSINIKGVSVTSERLPVEYQIDKKVINVDQQLTSTSGSAVDVLENAPSVTVDIDGNVQLRGSSNFTVLIDGRPSILDANDALEQIPSSTIDNIEIITNPSAKYDPDGTSGIINVILKKNRLIGLSGTINSNGGSHDRYGTDALLSYRNGKINSMLNLNFNKRNFPGNAYSERIFTNNNISTYLNSEGKNKRGGDRYGGRAEIDYSISDNDNLIFGFRYGNREMSHSSELDFTEWSDSNLTAINYSSENITDRGGDFYVFNLDYNHTFNSKDHKLSTQFIISDRDMEEKSSYSLFDDMLIQTAGNMRSEVGPSRQVRIKLDYVNSLSEKSKIEAGYQSQIGKAEDDNSLLDYNPVSGLYESDPLFDRLVEYHRDIHSLYFIYANESGKLGYQAGIRGEYTNRNIISSTDDAQFKLDRADYFPSVHLSYRINDNNQMMTSYSRRIKRARGWYMEPFLSWNDAFTVRQGNPDLKPEYINSFEFGYQKFIGRSMVSLETYYRITENRVEFVNSVYSQNVTLRSVENVGKDYALGTELMFNYATLDFLNMNFILNLYNYKVEGELNNIDYSSEDFSWNSRINSNIKLSDITRLQITNMYRSSTVTSQGESKGVFTTNIAIKQDFFSRALSATLQVNDIFSGSKREATSTSPGLYNYNLSERDSPTVMFTLKYNFNNFKPSRDQGRNGTDYGDDDF